jgi:hypothetical protein
VLVKLGNMLFNIRVVNKASIHFVFGCRVSQSGQLLARPTLFDSEV